MLCSISTGAKLLVKVDQLLCLSNFTATNVRCVGFRSLLVRLDRQHASLGLLSTAM